MRAGRLIRGVLLAALATGIAAGLYHARLLDVALVGQVAARTGDAAPLLFVLGYALATVLFVPGSILTIAGGALFGPVAGTFDSLSGATLGATLAFLVARHLASPEWIARRTGGRLAEFISGVEAEGWRFVAFVRLVPLLPFNALNYALGLTRISLTQYVVASYLAMLPGAAAYTYLGHAGRDAFAAPDELIREGLIAVALIAATLFLPRLARRLRRTGPALIELDALEQRLERREALTVIDVRGEDEYNGDLGHIPASLNIPLPDLPKRIAGLQALKDRALVLVCRTDKRSAKAAALLTAAGFKRVEVLRGGIERWNSRSGQQARIPANPIQRPDECPDRLTPTRP